MADTKKRKDISSLAKRKPRTNDESFDEDDLDDGKISNKATKISDAQQHQVEQIVLKAKLESKARLKYAHATDNELCEPKRDGPEVNFPTSKEEYEEFKTKMPGEVNWAELLSQFETTDMTEGAQELACVAGNCEI